MPTPDTLAALDRANDRQLADIARGVFRILRDDVEWNGDTFMAIVDLYKAAGLSVDDRPDVVEYRRMNAEQRAAVRAKTISDGTPGDHVAYLYLIEAALLIRGTFRQAAGLVYETASEPQGDHAYIRAIYNIDGVRTWSDQDDDEWDDETEARDMLAAAAEHSPRYRGRHEINMGALIGGDTNNH